MPMKSRLDRLTLLLQEQHPPWTEELFAAMSALPLPERLPLLGELVDVLGGAGVIEAPRAPVPDLDDDALRQLAADIRAATTSPPAVQDALEAQARALWR